MNDLELIFSMLGEAATTEITRVRDTNGFMENQEAAREGGAVAGKARKELEGRTGKKLFRPGIIFQRPESGKVLNVFQNNSGNSAEACGSFRTGSLSNC